LAALANIVRHPAIAVRSIIGKTVRTARSGYGLAHLQPISSAAMGALRAAWKLAALKQSRPLFLRCTLSGTKNGLQW
jgi:hypothetical protein